MKPLNSTFLTIATLVTLVTTTGLRAADTVRHEHKELTATSGGTLMFKAVGGAIDIKTHDADTVTFDCLIKPGHDGSSSELIEQIEFAYLDTNGDVTIRVNWKDDQHPGHGNLNVRHTLVVPAKYNIVVNTAGGAITGEDMGGRVDAHTSGGGISLGDIKGNADINTSGGNITLGQVTGDVIAKTSGGNINVGAVSGNLKGSTSGGSIRVELANQITQPLVLSTSGGNIRFIVPEDFKADLDARTSGGRVACDFPLVGKVKPVSSNGKVNRGGPEVTLRTSGGNIEVAKR